LTELLLHAAFALGGGLGAASRHLLTVAVTHRFPISTLVVNVLGCLLLGLGLVWLADAPGLLGEEERRLAGGFCGGFTTFSSFAYQTLDLHRSHTIAHAAVNIIVSLIFCLVAFGAGHWLGVALITAGS
jgi:CrcB protein